MTDTLIEVGEVQPAERDEMLQAFRLRLVALKAQEIADRLRSNR